MAVIKLRKGDEGYRESPSGRSLQRYRDLSTGELISYREGKKRAGTPLPTSRLIDRPAGRQLARRYAETEGVSIADVRQSPDFNKALRDIRLYGARARRRELNRTQAQRFAAALAVVHGKESVEWTNYVASV